MCYAFISGGVFEVTLGSILVFLLVAVLMNALNVYIYGAIKNEFQLGKTVESAVKSGYRKTMMMVIDVYAVLLLGSAALLIGIAGLNTLAMQALICVAAGAFCSLLWTRVINAIFLSGVKNKYKYLRCVREDDDDE
jgi:SecD/SecF fusion protein